MARGTRSQRPSQSQRKSQPQQQEEDDNEEIRMDEDEDDEDGEEVLGGTQGAAADIDRKARALARLMLFSEHKRLPVRRDDINKKVFNTNTRNFKAVFDKAQDILEKTFGMEIVELMKSEEKEKENGKEAETGLKKKVAPNGTKTYILRSLLKADLVAASTDVDETILEEEFAMLPEDDDETYPRTYGTAISWSTSDDLQEIGILYTILSLILVNGRVLSDTELRKTLKRLRLPSNEDLTNLLNKLLRANYLDQREVGNAKTKAGKAKGKRLRATQTQGGRDEDGGEGITYEWHWGPRAFAEVGEKCVAQLVAEFMGHHAQASEEQNEASIQKVFSGVEKAAGGDLEGVR